MSETNQNQSDRRLDSWKEIAAFFGRDERTVRRWEKDSALPVHRVPGSVKARVFAYQSELTQWLSTPRAVDTVTPVEPDALEPASLPLSVLPPTPKPSTRRRFLPAIWVAAAAISVSLLVGIVVHRRVHGFAVQASAAPHAGIPDRSNPARDAEEFYLKGRYYWNKRTPDDLNRAVDYFTQAIVRDPNFAPGYIGLADCYNLLREFSAMSPTEAYPRALAAAQKAVELAPNSAEAHNSLAFVEFWGYSRVADADRDFRRAIQLDPNSTRAHHWYATFLAELNRGPEALAEIERARQLDPGSTPVLADKGFVLAVMGNNDEAVALLKQIEVAEPSFLSAHSYLSGIYFYAGQYPQYFSEARTSARLQHDMAAEAKVAREERAFQQGGYPRLLAARLQADRELYDKGMIDDFDLGMDYSLLNQKQAALQHLSAAVEKRDPGICTLLINRSVDNLRQNPAFEQTLARAGLQAVSTSQSR